MVDRQRTDRRAEISQFRLRGTDPEQTAIFLHHVDAGTPISRIDHQMHCAIRRKDTTQRAKADVRVGKVVKHTGADDLVKAPANLADIFDREAMEVEVPQAVFALQLARMVE